MSKKIKYTFLLSLILWIVYWFIISPRVILPWTVQYWILVSPEIVFENLGKRVIDMIVYMLISLSITLVIYYFLKPKLKWLLLTVTIPFLLISLWPYIAFINNWIYFSDDEVNLVNNNIDILTDIDLVYTLKDSDREILKDLQHNLLKEINKDPSINGVWWKVDINSLEAWALERPNTWKLKVNYEWDSSQVMLVAKKVLSDSGLQWQYSIVLTPFESDAKKKVSNFWN